MRFTGRPLGAAARGGPRQTATQQVQFFADSTDLTTIRWYAVPADRPVIPFPSIFAAESLNNDVPWREGMQFGKLPGQQGMQMPGQQYHRQDPVDRYNPRHFCGTAAQWAGVLSIDNPADHGSVDCCFVVNDVLPGRADIVLAPAARLIYGLSYAGRAALSLRPVAGWALADYLPGRAPLTLRPAASWSYRPAYAGAAPLALTARSTLADRRTYAGAAPLALTARSVSAPGVPYAGKASLSLTAKSVPKPGVSYSGDVLLQITAKSHWTPGVSYAGKVSLSLTAKAGMVRPVSTCPQCPGGAAFNYLLTLSAGTGNWSTSNNTYLLKYAGSGCLWTAQQLPWSITLQFLSGAWLLEVSSNVPLTDARYHPTMTYQCLGANPWTLTSSFGTGTPPTATSVVFYDSR